MARKTRTRGEGTVYEVRPGTWLAQIQRGGVRTSATGASPGTAREALAARLAQRAEAASRVDDGLLGDYLLAWSQRVQRSLKPGTWRRYEQDVRLHLVPRLGGLRLDELQRRHIAALHTALRTRPRHPMTDTGIHHVHACLRVALQAAVDDGLVAVNVAAGYPAPRMTHKDKVILDREAVGRLIDAADGPLRALYVLAVTVGMRQGELLALRWADVNLAAGTLAVKSTAARDWDGRVTIQAPKTASGFRSFAVPRVALDALAATPRSLDGLVFAHPRRGGIMAGPNMSRDYFRPTLAAAGLPPMPFHDLRHTAATHMLRAQVPAHVVSRILGHSSVAVTLKLYGHATDEMRLDAADAVDRLYANRSANGSQVAAGKLGPHNDKAT